MPAKGSERHGDLLKEDLGQNAAHSSKEHHGAINGKEKWKATHPKWVEDDTFSRSSATQGSRALAVERCWTQTPPKHTGNKESKIIRTCNLQVTRFGSNLKCHGLAFKTTYPTGLKCDDLYRGMKPTPHLAKSFKLASHACHMQAGYCRTGTLHGSLVTIPTFLRQFVTRLASGLLMDADTAAPRAACQFWHTVPYGGLPTETSWYSFQLVCFPSLSLSGGTAWSLCSAPCCCPRASTAPPLGFAPLCTAQCLCLFRISHSLQTPFPASFHTRISTKIHRS